MQPLLSFVKCHSLTSDSDAAPVLRMAQMHGSNVTASDMLHS
jgi:hypothetical protein